MGICTDKSVNYLKSLNLNTILHPQEDLAPLALIGEYKGSRAVIGSLDQLVEDGGNLPPVTSGVAANINGQKSSRLPISLGINILGNILGAMGGNMGVNASYENLKKIEFTFSEVTRRRANTISVGDYLQNSEVRWNHLILKKYLFGSGKLFVITEIVTSRKIGVTAFRTDNTAVKLDVPVIQQAVGGSVAVSSESQSSATITYEGPKDLAFGFVAIELSAGERGDDGELDLVFRPVNAGDASFSVLGGPMRVADFEGALPSLDRCDPATLGEA